MPSSRASPPPRQSSIPALPDEELDRVAQHVRDSLTDELYDNFELFLYVSKAVTGPWAQHLFVFEKEPEGGLVELNDWLVSTGRERDEFNKKGVELPGYTPQ